MSKVTYYRCNYCYHVGLVVTKNKWFLCAGYRCGKNLRVKDVKITKGEYYRVWG